MAISIKGNISDVVYGKGDICLKINPFDNFRMFTLYEDWRGDDRVPIDLSNGQKIYLVFKSSNKEIRIPEYDVPDSVYTVDKVNGQVLFKISKKNAIDILSLDSKIFYITRVYDTTDYTGDNVLASDEEVLYSGQWRDETSNAIDNYTTQIKNLMRLLEDRNKKLRDLQGINGNLMKQNAEYAARISELQEESDKMSSELSTLEAKLAEYESGTEYSGTVIGQGTHHTIISGRQYTEDELKRVVDQYEETLVGAEPTYTTSDSIGVR